MKPSTRIVLYLVGAFAFLLFIMVSLDKVI